MNSTYKTVIFGEVLYDCFPDGNRVLGGAPFNVAWHCQAFGLNPFFISRVGKDKNGDEIINKMKQWGMQTQGVQVDEEHPTGIVEVTISDNEPSYYIREDSAWDFIESIDLSSLDGDFLLYHGSLALRNLINQKLLDSIICNNNPSVFTDINLRNPWWDKEYIDKILIRSDYAKLNEDELFKISGKEKPVKKLMADLVQDKKLQMLIVTRGEKGAIIMDAEQNIYEDVPAKNSKFVDTVGAGDAFSSIFLVGYHYGWSTQQKLSRALDFANSIVGIKGATIEDNEFYKPFIEKWQIPV